MSGVEVVVEDAVATVTLSRPSVGNALDQQSTKALAEVVEHCRADPAVRVVVLTGTGRFFCVGGDVAAMARAGDDVGPFVAELARSLHGAVLGLARMAKPLVCSVGGPAAGAGMSLALLGDLVLAAESAHFSVAYPAVGLTPDGGSTWLLPRLVGLRRAQELLLTNRRVSATEAAAMGLVTRTVPDDTLPAETRQLAQQLRGAPTEALAGARALLLGSFAHELEGHLRLEAERITAAAAGPEGREGLAAFLAKRPPAFER